ncbi:hypothetical protein [Shouchella lehensis]|nr:hypothetical protein [Shouchella lehensis]
MSTNNEKVSPQFEYQCSIDPDCCSYENPGCVMILDHVSMPIGCYPCPS